MGAKRAVTVSLAVALVAAGVVAVGRYELYHRSPSYSLEQLGQAIGVTFPPMLEHLL
jgi:hypothetical protein